MKKFFKSLLVIFATMVAMPAHAALPSGYTELEYIESTRTQYIDTGVSNAGGLIIETKAQPTNPSYTGDQAYVGNVQQNADKSRNLIAWKGGQWHVQKLAKYNGDGVSVADDGLNPAIIKFDNIGNNYKWWYNGTQIADLTVNGTLDSNTGNVLISKINYNDMIANGRYYYVKIWDSNESLVRNMIPAKRDSDSAIGMYDTVNNRFYENIGTGTFTAGPAKCRNLFDKNAATTGAYINKSTGVIVSNQPNYGYTDYIPVVAGEQYYINTRSDSTTDADGVAQYNSNKEWQSGTSVNALGGVYTVPEGISYIRCNFRVTKLDTLQIERGATATDYVPFCAEIKIATTAYNAAAFAPVEQALESAVTTIKDVVANTITQADAIQNLQDAKQTRPDAECPKFRQCLLVENDDGTPEWFRIVDPFRDFVTPILANNDHITAVNEQRRYAGDLDLCRMLPQTDAESQANNDIAKCTGVANAKNTATDNPEKGNLKQTEWGYEFKAADLADNPNNDSGIVYGISKCVSTAENNVLKGTYAKPATSTQLNHALWDARPTTMAEASTYENCWCKTTGIAYGGQYYETSAAPWVFVTAYGSAADCASDCASGCARHVRYNADFRKGIMGWAVE